MTMMLMILEASWTRLLVRVDRQAYGRTMDWRGQSGSCGQSSRHHGLSSSVTSKFRRLLGVLSLDFRPLKLLGRYSSS